MNDCQIDTDMELMFGADYIENVSERISLYRELDSMDNEEQLAAFRLQLEDRFGKMPEQSQQLLMVVRLRWLAIKYGVEKLVLKNGKMIAYLVSNPMSMYYQSEAFGKVLHYMATHPRKCQLREQNQRRSVVFEGVKSIEEAFLIFSF